MADLTDEEIAHLRKTLTEGQKTQPWINVLGTQFLRLLDEVERARAARRMAFEGDDPTTRWDGLTTDQIASTLTESFGEVAGTPRGATMWWSIRDALRSFARQSHK